jgi:hypothetical protein
MVLRSFQFGLSTLLWLVAFCAFNCWLFSMGAWGIILAAVIDKHVLVAYLCMLAQVDRREAGAPPAGAQDAKPQRLGLDDLRPEARVRVQKVA